MNNYKKTAVALSYPQDAPAPFLVASGRGALAEQIVSIAKEENIPIVKDIQTAAILSLYEVGDYIPEQTYNVIATIFAYIYRIKDGTEQAAKNFE